MAGVTPLGSCAVRALKKKSKGKIRCFMAASDFLRLNIKKMTSAASTPIRISIFHLVGEVFFHQGLPLRQGAKGGEADVVLEFLKSYFF